LVALLDCGVPEPSISCCYYLSLFTYLKPSFPLKFYWASKWKFDTPTAKAAQGRCLRSLAIDPILSGAIQTSLSDTDEGGAFIGMASTVLSLSYLTLLFPHALIPGLIRAHSI
jgi:hypothetical protein